MRGGSIKVETKVLFFAVISRFDDSGSIYLPKFQLWQTLMKTLFDGGVR